MLEGAVPDVDSEDLVKVTALSAATVVVGSGWAELAGGWTRTGGGLVAAGTLASSGTGAGTTLDSSGSAMVTRSESTEKWRSSSPVLMN